MPLYVPTPTLTKFHHSDAFYRGVLGPVGSGKSTATCMEITTRAAGQDPDQDGVRRTRWAIVRNTFRELRDTTAKTWLEWITEEQFGSFNNTAMEHHIKVPMPDGTRLDCLVLFRALDRPQDVKKLLSLELTGAWVNEAREIPFAIVQALGDRVERYPANPTWSGVMMDTNPPDTDHWWYRLAEEDRPDGWEFWRQPGGLIESGGKFVHNPNAENFRAEDEHGQMLLDEAGNPVRGGIPTNYYLRRMSGKNKDHIRVYYCAEYGFVRDGKPVYPEFSDSLHVPEQPIEPVPGLPLYVGVDFGLTPAAVFGQRLASGRWIKVDELVTEDMGAVRFAELLSERLHGRYSGWEYKAYGDPAGSQRAQTDERTPFEILRGRGIDIIPAPSNDPDLRREAVALPLTRIVDGVPGMLISPRCKMLRKGMAGGYCYKRVQVSGDERFHDKPDKGRYSHVCDADQYLMLGAGEGHTVTGRKFFNPADIARLPDAEDGRVWA